MTKLTMIPVVLLGSLLIGSCSVSQNSNTSNSQAEMVLPAPVSYPSAASLSGSHYSQTQADQKCHDAWSYFKTELLQDSGAVLHTDTNSVVSEGQSYGMMLAVQNNDQAAFDKIWYFTKTYMQTGNSYGLFAWKVSTNGTVIGATPAPDADVMIAMALILASQRWGDQSSPYDYSVQAKSICQNILQYEVTSDHYLAFSPDDKTMFSPSYMMPAFYRLFASFTGEERWNLAADRSFDLIEACQRSEYGNLANGLVPDHSNKDGSLRSTGQTFYYDAVRTPFFAALDHIWSGQDSRAQNYCDQIAGFFGPSYSSFGDKYDLNGSRLSSNHVVSWIGCLAGGAMGGSDDTAKVNFYNHLMSCDWPAGQYRYYDICWLNFGLLLTSGNLRIYN